MTRCLLIVVVLACAGCNRDPRTLSKQELESVLCEKAQFAKVELLPVNENVYAGTGSGPDGLTYDLKVQLTRDYVDWRASTKTLPISKKRIEQLVVSSLNLTDFTIEPKGADWGGKGTMKGREVEFQIQVEDGRILIEWTTDKGGKFTIYTNTSEQKTRSGSFKP